MKANLTLLGIESSCDETSASVIINGEIRSNRIATQEVHIQYGGVVPELASRAHQSNIVPVVDQAIREAGIQPSDIDAIAYTRGPGLLGALLVGASFAKAMALALQIPLIEVHHMHAHIHSLFIREQKVKQLSYPFLCMTVSGGHTQLIRVNAAFEFKLLGETLDDAAGEAFDKIGKLMGLPYPAGPHIDRLAKSGKTDAFNFPIPEVPGLNFSFSGLKTSVMNFLNQQTLKDPSFISSNLNDLCASVQFTIVRILTDKLILAMKQEHLHCFGIAGGVSANSFLRERLQDLASDNGWSCVLPAKEFTTDNAAMVASSGYLGLLEGRIGSQANAAQASMSI